VKSVQCVSMKKSTLEKTRKDACFKSKVKKRGVIDGESGGDDRVDPTCSTVEWSVERPRCGSRKESESSFQK